jgi:ubiquitin-conjugating enzyme E2 I
MSGVATARLAEERRSWRTNHPFGFIAKPRAAPDGATNLMVWDCHIPGKPGTPWAGGLFPLTLVFSSNYPSYAPIARFPSGFVHPNVFETGEVCLSIIGDAWRPSISVGAVLLGIQELLHTPNERDPANGMVNTLYLKRPTEYDR